jgi:glutathione S-transferase
MQLIGRTVSPFVRRVAATLNLYGMPFEGLPYATNTHAAEVARYNPLGRIPALVTDAGARSSSIRPSSPTGSTTRSDRAGR